MFLISLLAEQDEVMMRSLLSSEQVQVHSVLQTTLGSLTLTCASNSILLGVKKWNINTLFKQIIPQRDLNTRELLLLCTKTFSVHFRSCSHKHS